MSCNWAARNRSVFFRTIVSLATEYHISPKSIVLVNYECCE